MRPSQQILTTTLWAVAVMGMLAIVGTGLWGAHRPDDPSFVVRAAEESNDQPLFEMPAFKLVDQNSNPFTDESLRGHVWIGSFVFTRCAGPCPIIMSKLAVLQKTLPEANIRLVSFTVDPEFDTPTVLKQRADELHADPAKWSFVTGDKDAVDETLHQFLQPNPNQGKDQPLMHDTHLYLFDAAGKCRKRYSINDEDEMAKLVVDAKARWRNWDPNRDDPRLAEN